MQIEECRSIVLVLAADESYAQPMAVTIFSVLENISPGRSIDLFLIDGGLQPHQRMRIERIAERHSVCVSVHWTSVSPAELSRLPLVRLYDTFSKATLFRLWIPDLLPKECTKAIYLDSDILVEGDIVELWEEPLDESVLAVQDYWIPYISSPNGITYFNEMDMRSDAPYFNAGLMVLNIDKWRANDVQENTIEHLTKYANYLSHNDQEGLNAVLIDDWRPLSVEWNVHHDFRYKGWKDHADQWSDSLFIQMLRERQNKLVAECKALHFTGSSKPWIDEISHPKGYDWFRYLWASGWLSREERIRSQLLFYSRYYPREVLRRGADYTRPYRHKLANRLPSGFADALRR